MPEQVNAKMANDAGGAATWAIDEPEAEATTFDDLAALVSGDQPADAPATDATSGALSFSVRHRPRTADDVDPVLTGQRPGPSADHVVVAAVAVVSEYANRDGV